jgi:hypothetical protein
MALVAVSCVTARAPREVIRRDSAIVMDSAIAVDRPDSAKTATDSVAAPDTTPVVKDSVVTKDSTVTADSAVAKDTTVARDSATVRDSTASADTTAGRDSTVVRDSTATDSTRVVADSTAVARVDSEPPAPRRRVPPVNVRLASGRTLKDSVELARATRAGLANAGWPVKTPPPLPGSLLPAKRIVAFYGTPLSRRMGILGQYPQPVMLAKLDSVTAEWNAADSTTPVQQALHFIAVVAQAAPGKDGKYRLRMDSSLIEKVYGWARERGAVLFLDIQAGHSTIVDELPRLAKFLERPDVHLGVDPEFNMRYVSDTIAPGKMIGYVKAAEINETVAFLAKLVETKKIPPKVLVIHRFRGPMVRNVKDIKLDPRVQMVMHMDGWGIPAVKYGSYKNYIVDEPLQFAGFKLFYRHDTQRGDKLIAPFELLQLYPRPLYIQYQ